MISALTAIHTAIFSGLEKIATPVLTTFARFIFAATLLVYYWNSGLTKLGDGFLGLGAGRD